jgi:hypothetical protein
MRKSRPPDRLREAASDVPELIGDNKILFLIPSVLLAVGAVLDAWVSPLHSFAPAAVALTKGLAWGLYLRVTMRFSGGVLQSSALTPVVGMALSFAGIEFGGAGLIVPALIWFLPFVDYALLYGEAPDAAMGGVLDTLKVAPGLWFGSMLALLIGLVMVGLVFSLPMSLYITYAQPDGAWLADVSGGALVGPLVHVGLVFRARLLLAIHGEP